MEREYMEFDVVIVGAGPAGLSAACRLKQKAAEAGQEISVCVVEKGSEVGAHILSGAVFEPRALNELFPDWKELGAPLNTPVTGDDIYVLKSAESATKVPNFFVPKTMHNEGNYIISLGNLCRWLAQQAEGLGVEIYPGFAAQEALIDENGVVRGIVTGDLGVDREGNPKEGYYTPGMELRAKYTLFAEGCRGHIGKQLIKKYNLDSEADAQHYGIGIKEIWDIDPSKHKPGLVVHTAGPRPWPLAAKAATSCPTTSMRSRPAGCTTNCSAAATSARPSTSSALSAAARSTSSTRTSSAARSPSPCMTTSRTTPA